MNLQVDIREILAMAWDNPLITGGVVLLFTTPMFRLIVFFYPLLICTALCVAALISAGQQIEVSREREITGWNAKIVDSDGLRTKLGSAKGLPNEGPKEDTWLKNSVEDFKPSGFASSDEIDRSNWMSDISLDEGLKKHQFRVDDGRMVFLDDQDLLDRQIEAFREYERNFSIKTRAEATAVGAIASVSNGGASPSIGSSPSSRTISIPEERNSNCDVPARKIPPSVLYNLRTGGTGRAGKASDVEGAEALGTGSSPSTRTISIPEERDSNCDSPTRQIPPMVHYNLRTGGTGRVRKASSGTGAEVLSGSASGAPAAVSNSQEKTNVVEGFSYGSIDMSRNVNFIESSFAKHRSSEPPLPLPLPRRKPSSGVGTTATSPGVEMLASPFATLKDFDHNPPKENDTWPGLIESQNRVEGELSGFTKTFGGKEKDSLTTSVFAHKGPAITCSSVASVAKRSEERYRAPTGKLGLKRLFAPLGPVINSSRAASPSKPFEDRSLRRSRTYNSGLRSGNAVLYNASSHTNVLSSTRNGSSSVHRK